VRRSDIRRELRKESAEDVRPPGRLPLEVFQARPTGRRPCVKPRIRWRDYISQLAWDPPELKCCRWEGNLGQPAGSAVSATRPRTKRMRMDGCFVYLYHYKTCLLQDCVWLSSWRWLWFYIQNMKILLQIRPVYKGPQCSTSNNRV